VAGKRGVVSVAIQATTAQFRRGMTRAQKILQRFSAKARAVRSSLTGMFGMLAGGVLVHSAIRTLAQFEETMARLRGVTGATERQFAALTEKARELGSVTRFSASQAAEGLLSLSRIGFTVNESLASIGATLDLATAQSMDFATAADIAASAVRQFGLQASDTQRVADVFSNTANSAGTTVLDAAEAMKLAGTAAAAFGNDIESTAAAIGVLGDVSIRGTMAGTSLRGIMAELGKATGDQLKAIEDLGLSYDDVNPKTTDLVTIFERLAAANFGVDEAMRIFTKRTFVAALALTKYSGKLRELTEANRAAKGTTRELAALMEDTLVGSFLALRSAVEETVLQTGDKGLGGSLKGLVDRMTDAVRILNESPGAFEDASEGGRKLAATLEGIGRAWDAVSTSFMLGIDTIQFAIEGLIGGFHMAAIAALKVAELNAKISLVGSGLAPVFKAAAKDQRSQLEESRERLNEILIRMGGRVGRGVEFERRIDPEGFAARVAEAARRSRMAIKTEIEASILAFRKLGGAAKSAAAEFAGVVPAGPSLPPVAGRARSVSGAYATSARPREIDMDEWLERWDEGQRERQQALALALQPTPTGPGPGFGADIAAGFAEAGRAEANALRVDWAGEFGDRMSSDVAGVFSSGIMRGMREGFDGDVVSDMLEGFREAVAGTIIDAITDAVIRKPLANAIASIGSSLATSAA